MPLRTLSAIFFLMSVVALCLAPAVARADQVSDWEAMREQQQKNYDNMVANMPLLERTRVQDVLQVRMDGKSLTVRTPLQSTRSAGFMRVKLAGMSQYALVRVQGGNEAGNADGIVPTNFQFNLTDYSQPRQITTLAVNTQATFFNIAKSVQFPSGYRNVQVLEQKAPAGSEHGGALTLVVNEATGAGQQPLNVNLEAEDFFTFMRRVYPHEADLYLRPLLRELGQESVFAPDPLIAWQVFAELWKPDATAAKKVAALLPELDVPDYRVRERALRGLQALGREGAAVMVHLDRANLSPEQNNRLDRALAPFAQLPPKEAMRLHSDPGFLLDCLYCDDVTLRRAALARYREFISPDVRLDADADAASRSAAVAALRAKLPGNVATESAK